MFLSTAFENGKNTNKFIYTNKLILFESLSTKPINMQVYIKICAQKVNINTVIRSSYDVSDALHMRSISLNL